MKKIYTSVIAATLLTTSACAESSTIKEAFANGKASGDISVFSENVSKSGTNKDSGFTMSSIGLNYETDSINGFKGALGFRTNHKISEKEKADFDETTPKSVLSTANISYSTEKATIVAGRQEIDLEWIGDYHEAVVGVLSYVPNTTIVVGHTERKMAVDNDAVLEKMSEFNPDGANVVDVKYDGIKGTTVNPYFMDAPDLFSAYGLKVTTNVSNIDLTAHYAGTSEDVAGKKDGSIVHLEVGTSVSNIALTAGYITTGKDNGAGTISALGDNIDPTEDLGDNIYGTDADTFYLGASTDISSVSLSALYTTVNYGANDDKISEVVLTAGTTISENLALDLLVSSIDAQNSSDDTSKITLMAAYSF